MGFVSIIIVKIAVLKNMYFIKMTKTSKEALALKTCFTKIVLW